MTLGQRIQQIRQEHRLSQEEFAEKLGTTRQTVSRWELDQTFPEIARIVQISRIFSVTTDSILKDGVSTFDGELADYPCGVYRGAHAEMVETEKFALLYYEMPDQGILGTKLYQGFEGRKRLTAICERDQRAGRTDYAYFIQGSSKGAVSNSERLSGLLDTAYDPEMKRGMRRLEQFSVDHQDAPLPTVREAGIPRCLTLWRMADSYHADREAFRFFLCTGRTEYIFSIRPQDTDIYCGASYNLVFDLGLFSGGQFFRIRNYRDNSEPYCKFHCDFSYEAKDVHIPTEECRLGQCLNTSLGLMWCVKRYNDEEIVLQGCGEDEYTYRRKDKRTERFVLPADA